MLLKLENVKETSYHELKKKIKKQNTSHHLLIPEKQYHI